MWRRRHVSDMSRGRPSDGRAGGPTATDVLSGFHAHVGPLALSYAALALTRLATRLLNCRRKCRAPVTVFYASRSAQHPARCGIARSHAVRCPVSSGRRPATVGGARAWVPCRLPFSGGGGEGPTPRRARRVEIRERSRCWRIETARTVVGRPPSTVRFVTTGGSTEKDWYHAFTRVECYE